MDLRRLLGGVVENETAEARMRPSHSPLKGRYFAHGLPSRLLKFYELHPTLELTRAEICARFHTTRANVSMVVRKLIDEGRVESVNVVRLPKRKP